MNLSNEEKEKCLLLWGAIPTDIDFVRLSALFNGYKHDPEFRGSATEKEIEMKKKIKGYFKSINVEYS